MSVLLVMSTGQTDIQLVQDGRRTAIVAGRSAEIHDEICARGYMFAAAPRERGPQADSLPPGPVTVCTPKLDAVWNLLAQHVEPPAHVLLLGTSRAAASNPSDPRRAGEILRKRIMTMSSHATVGLVHYLTGDDRLEEPDDPRGQLISREIVARINLAIATAVRGRSYQRVVVAPTGGFKEIGTLVEAIVRLHAMGTEVQTIKVPDTLGDDVAVSSREVPDPAESFRARRNALELIARGNLHAAWGSVQHLASDGTERWWISVVEWLAIFASALPMPTNCDLDVLTHPRIAVQAALRVEFSLRCGDVPRAVHGTVAFFEAALWDALSDKGVRGVTRSRRRQLYTLAAAPPHGLVGDAASSATDRPFVKRRIRGVDAYEIHDSARGAQTLASRYLESPALTELAAATSRVRYLRNDVAHSVPTPTLMDDAVAVMRDAGLWHPLESSAGVATFLAQPIVNRALSELSVPNPYRLADDLLAEVRQRLLLTTGVEA